MDSWLRTRLSLMMFLQYAVWGAWAVSMGAYCSVTLKFSGLQIGGIYSTTAIAAMISPLVMGVLADRLFATQHLIGTLHLLGGGLLFYASTVSDFTTLFVVMLVYALCYMPTLALTNSISFANIADPEKQFPGIRVFGTWGWIIVGWVVGFVLNATTNVPLQLAAGLSVVLGLFSFVLPHTPPRGDAALDTDRPAGPGILSLLSDPSFLIFTVSSFLICIPLSLYYGFANLFLQELEAPAPTALQTTGQMSEVLFMAAMPFFITRLGVKNMLAIGMLAWVARYFLFGTLAFPLIVAGLILHGVCYDFFFVASQIYVDSRVSGEQRARAQSFIAFVTLGLGMFVGSIVGGIVVDTYPPKVQVRTEVIAADGNAQVKTPSLIEQFFKLLQWSKGDGQEKTLPAWDASGESGFASALQLKADSTLALDQLPDELVDEAADKSSKSVVKKADLEKVFAAIDTDGNMQLSRAEWVVARQRQWPMIWLCPALMAAVTCALFWVGFRNPAKADAAGREAAA